MAEKLGFSQADDVITIRLTDGDYMLLMLALGIATGNAFKDSSLQGNTFLDLTNRINEGNTHYIPYELVK